MSSPASPRRALDPPAGPLVALTDAVVEAAIAASRTSPRRRVILPFHKSEADLLHRMLNAAQPDTYVRPHRHLDPPKAEAWIALRGALAFFTFDEGGRVQECLRVGAGEATCGVDLEPGIYHSFVALVPDTVIYEVKTGPFAPATDKTFAPWAPAEGDPAAAAYREALRAEHERRRQAAADDVTRGRPTAPRSR